MQEGQKDTKWNQRFLENQRFGHVRFQPNNNNFLVSSY